MIRVSRSGFEPSARWQERAREEQARCADSYGKDRSGRFDFRVFMDREIRSLLEKMFRGKCAYCESAIGATGSMDLEHYRPKSTVETGDGTAIRPGYWWLASSWDNLYASCSVCNRNKANRFPLADESQRARRPADELAAEQPLILDPCRDDPERHLVFSADGYVSDVIDPDGSSLRIGARAQTTIDILGLNRGALVDARARAARQLRARVDSSTPPSVSSLSEIREWFLSLVDLDGGYVALQRQLLEEWSDEFALTTAPPEVMPASEAEELEEGFTKRQKARKQAASEQRHYQEELSSVSLEDESKEHLYRSSRIDRVTIVNFKCVDYLQFTLRGAAQDRAGWKMLLGENGAGKSTVLQAIALALMGERSFSELVEAQDLDPSTLLRRGEDGGYVEVLLGTDLLPRRVVLGPDGHVEFGGAAAQGARTTLLGFGSARWLYRPGGLPSDQGEYIRVRNLFNPFVPLGDAVAWLLSLGRADFRKTEEALLRLLGLDNGQRLRRRKETEVKIEEPGRPESRWNNLRDLSDGYQTVLAMIGDILELVTRRYPDIEAAEGVVLIDEIGAHLHPRWKMDVVRRLRDAFPQVQFIATTHEPLCLRGLGEGEVLLMRSAEEDEEGEIIATDDVPNVADLRVGQLLTSELFGLHTTFDPELDRDLERYYFLLGRSERTDDEDAELDVLRSKVGSKGILGETPRDQAIYKVVDDYVATKSSDDEDERELTEEMKREVAEIWSEIAAAGDDP